MQRRVILEEGRDDSKAKELKNIPVKIHPEKIERWEREEKLAGLVGKSTLDKERRKQAADRRLPDRALSPIREIIEIHDGSTGAGMQPRTMWDLADIPGSPKLSRFINFLKIDEEFPIPPPLSLPPREPGFITSEDWIDLHKQPVNDNAESRCGSSTVMRRTSKKRCRSPSPTQLFICKWLLSQIEKPWTPLNELSPFPTKVTTRKTRTGVYIDISPVRARGLRIGEHENRLRKMQQTLLPNSAGVIGEMDTLAGLYFGAGKYEAAESLFHRVAKARQDAFGPSNIRTLKKYLDIITTKQRLGEYSKALTLHQDLHTKIQELCNPYDDLALQSRRVLASTLRLVERYEEAEKLHREILQITLGEFGTKHANTADAMESLGTTMALRNQYAQCEHLLSTALQIASQNTENVDLQSQTSKTSLALCLNGTWRYEEACRLLKDVVKSYILTLGMEHPETLNVIAILSNSLSSSGQLEDSEILLAKNLQRKKTTHGLTHPKTSHAILIFANVMENLGQWTESADLYEQLYRIGRERDEPDHKYTNQARGNLDYCYAMQGLYADQGAFQEKLNSILESKADFSKIFTQRRKYGRMSGARDDDSEELEEIRPEKRRRTLTCTLNFKREQK